MILIVSCGSSGGIVESSVDVSVPETVVAKKEPKQLSLLFAGDVMAHSVNYANENFDRIWLDVKDLVSSADLAFANIEAPVVESLDWSTYPSFNMHHAYIQAVIDCGFDVFSLANNHTNDQLLKGIKETKKYFDSLKSKEIYSCGIKSKASAPLTYQVIEKNGIKVLFVAITQLLNRPDASTWIDYYPSTSAKTAQLKKDIKKLKTSENPDIFVLSVHTDEVEYVRTVADSRKTLYKELVTDCGVDVLWSNHPHVVKEWEIVSTSGNRDSLILYATGNTISGQRTNPQFKKPETERDFTGDGLFVKVVFEKNTDELKIKALEPSFITTYKAPTGQYVLRRMNDEFIHSLEHAEMLSWAKYIKERKKIMEKIRGPQIWQ